MQQHLGETDSSNIGVIKRSKVYAIGGKGEKNIYICRERGFVRITHRPWANLPIVVVQWQVQESSGLFSAWRWCLSSLQSGRVLKKQSLVAVRNGLASKREQAGKEQKLPSSIHSLYTPRPDGFADYVLWNIKEEKMWNWGMKDFPGYCRKSAFPDTDAL